MADIYKIGVSIGMKDNASAVVSALASKFLGLNVAVKDVEGNLNKLRLAAVGVFAVWGGTKALEGLNALAKAGSKLQDQQTAMAKAGMTHLEIIQETKRAYQSMSEVRGPDVTDRIKSILELRSIIGAGKNGHDYGEINAVLPSFLKVRSLYGDEGSKEIFRAVEQQGGARFNEDGSIAQHGALFKKADGVFDDARFSRYVDAAVKVLQASVGTITPRDLKNVMSMASVTARGMDPEAFWGMMMTPMIEMGGFRAGTAATAMSRAFYGGIMPQRNAEELERLGVIGGVHVLTEAERKALHLPEHLSKQDRRDLAAQGYRFGQDGRVILSRGALAGSDVLNDPSKGIFPWLRDFVSPRLHSDYEKNVASHPGNTETFDAYVRDEIYKALPTETARRFGALIVQQLTSVARDQNLMKQAAGVDAAYDANQGNYQQQLDNLKKSWASFMQTIGLPAAQDGAHILKALGEGIDSLTRQAEKHPDAAKNLIRFAAGVSAVTAVSGAAAVAGMALGPLAKGIGLLAVGARGLGGAIAGIEAAGVIGTMSALGVGLTAVGAALLVLYGAVKFWQAGSSLGADGSKVTWKDHADPFQMFHHHASAADEKNKRDGYRSYFDNIIDNMPVGNARPSGGISSGNAHQTHVTITPAPVVLDGKRIGEVNFTAQYRSAMQQLRSTSSGADGLAMPQYPGAALAH
ncbi:phage tail tape measure protein [Acetobacter sicerae]|uniref:hypothetical protein n=1 Tax=Acetobacter sicerae TaxID=85325 RepID=UPI00156B0B1C|nr:hypothetical protein [Acetobacter sicerae]NHN93632.1 hypothetical protein [Acetobacter sicerae]